jgi:hypothetical protein
MAQHRPFATRGATRIHAGDFPEPANGRAVRPPRRRPLLYNRAIDKFLILLLPITWFAYYSWRPIYRLRADMPAQFVDLPAAASAAERAREQRLAQAYWNLARTAFRPRYAFGSPLPDEPPLDFKLGPSEGTAPPARTEAKVTRAEASDSRLRYWRKLQQLWLEPYAWEAKREWSTAWFTGPFLRLYVNLQDYVSNRFKAI